MIWLGLIGAIAFYVAWNLGANDVANSMGTSVGSGAVRLGQALLIAGILEFAGAVLFGQQVTVTLAGKVVNATEFAQAPQSFVWGMVAALSACGIWLQIATNRGLPVASSHAVVGAIAGFGWVAGGVAAVNWRSLLQISLAWLITPLISGAIAALFYALINRWIFRQANPAQQLMEWLPWLSAMLVTVFGWLLLPVLEKAVYLPQLSLPPQTVILGLGAIATSALTMVGWQSVGAVAEPGDKIQGLEDDKTPPLPQSSTLNLPFARFQLLSACGVAFAHGANDVGNAIAPLAVIAVFQQTQALPMGDFEIPLWILALGAAGIVGGLAVSGKAVMATIGQGIIPLVPSTGFCAELATASTVLLATRMGLPVSTSHALVGAVVGVGIVQRIQNAKATPIQTGTLWQIGLAWVLTIPVCAGLAAAIFSAMQAVL